MKNTIETRTDSDPKLLIIDTETTGLNSAEDHVMFELCLMIPDQKFTQAQIGLWFFELTNEEIARSNPEVLKINHYFDRIKEEQQGMYWVSIKDRVRTAQKILKWTENAIFAGDNVSFDIGFLKSWIRSRNLEPNWDYHSLELQSMTIGLLGGNAPWPFNSKDVADMIDIPFPKDCTRHTAFGDSMWNFKRLRKMLRLKMEPLRIVKN